MLHKDILHEILLHVRIEDLLKVYIIFRPILSIEYYINRLVIRVNTIWSYTGRQATIHYIPHPRYSQYCVNGIIHRSDSGPAIYSDDLRDQAWFKCGMLHRDGGPAMLLRDRVVYSKYGIIYDKIFKYRPHTFISTGICIDDLLRRSIIRAMKVRPHMRPKHIFNIIKTSYPFITRHLLTQIMLHDPSARVTRAWVNDAPC